MAEETTLETTGTPSNQHGEAHAEEHHEFHIPSDTVTIPLLGEITVPGGIYTVVFGYLGILTVLEVIIAEFVSAPEGSALEALKIFGLVATSLGKAVLVVLFYMHLRWDNRILWVVLILPTIVVLISVLYLLSVPSIGGGLGYLP